MSGNVLSKKLFWKIILARKNERHEKDQSMKSHSSFTKLIIVIITKYSEIINPCTRSQTDKQELNWSSLVF